MQKAFIEYVSYTIVHHQTVTYFIANIHLHLYIHKCVGYIVSGRLIQNDIERVFEIVIERALGRAYCSFHISLSKAFWR